jgi:tetratricopeptide (TPR) repeat protein
MGRYSRRDEGLRVLLSSQEGWGKYRDMALFEAAGLFKGGAAEADHIGAARSYLALADTFAALDELFLGVEVGYFEALASGASAGERARMEAARQRQTAAGAQGPDPAAVEKQVRNLSGKSAGRGAYARAAQALVEGAPAEALAALQRLEVTRVSRAAGPDLFAYLLYRRACAGLALQALGKTGTPETAFLAGLAREHLGDDAGAAVQYAAAEEGKGTGADAAWLFSPCLGAGEAARLAAVRRGAILQRAGRPAEALAAWQRAVQGAPGPLVTAMLADCQVRSGASKPLDDPAGAVETAVAQAAGVPALLRPGGPDDLLPSIYPVRVAAVSRAAADALRRTGKGRRTQDVMERAHRKATGFRPDFVNDPAFLVDLSRAYAEAGDYAPAVAVLFELSRQYPSVRLAYESLKRLYAAHTGGETQPRY